MVHATEDDVLYEEPRSVLAEEMARGREPSVVSHDTSGAAAKTVTRAERPRRPRMQQEMMKDEADGHYVKMKADGHL